MLLFSFVKLRAGSVTLQKNGYENMSRELYIYIYIYSFSIVSSKWYKWPTRNELIYFISVRTDNKKTIYILLKILNLPVLRHQIILGQYMMIIQIIQFVTNQTDSRESFEFQIDVISISLFCISNCNLLSGVLYIQALLS